MVFRSAGWRNRMLGIRVLPPRNSQGNPHQEIRKVVRHASCCATLTSLKSISYENVVAFRAVIGSDGMTADWYHFPHDVLGRISSHIINQVRGINRVVYDVSSKPPATIEWE